MANKNTQDIYSSSAKSRAKKPLIISAAVIAAILVGVFGGMFAKQLYADYQHRKEVAAAIDVPTFYQGITVAGVDVGGKTMEEAKAAVSKVEPTLRDKYDITMAYGDKNWKLTEDDFSFQFNTEEVLKEAYAYAREGDREERYRQVEELKTKPKDFKIAHTMNYDSLHDKMKDIAKQISYPAVDATVASFDMKTATFHYADGKDGLEVDQNKLYTLVENIINGPKTGTVEVPARAVPFSKTIADIKSHLQKLGTYSTTSTNSAAGFHNMKLALSKINGACIPAGGTFSFNQIVGNSDKAHGFLEAGAILNGKLIQADGGGICQTSTTVYGAALRSNMKITQRSNHTLQSTYCPIGQDAAVSYPELDFKFQNPTDYPIYIVTSTVGKVLTATFYGYQSPDYDRIEVTSQKTATIPAPTTPKYTVDKTLDKGVVKLEAKARDGARATAQRVFYKNGAIVKTENLLPSYYRAQPAYYLIGPGTDVSSTTAVINVPSSSAPTSSAPKPESSKPAVNSQSSSSAASSAAQSAQSSASAASSADSSLDGIVIPN